MFWNVGALAISGACGIVLNGLIARSFGDSALGVFNQVFAAYILFSQFAVMGVHLSVLRHSAASSEPQEIKALFTSGVALTTVIALPATALFFGLAGPISTLFDSPGVATGIVYAAPGLFFFALSKVVLSVLNGVRRMRAYALLQGARFAVMLVAAVAAATLELESNQLAMILSISEACTFFLSLFAARDLFGLPSAAQFKLWVDRHLRFGAKGFMAGIVLELNTRIDVLVLAAFASDATVGIYSFAAILAEGFLQLLIVLRSNYNPILTRLLTLNDLEALLATVRRGRNLTYAITTSLGGLAVLGYMLCAPLVSEQLTASWPLFGILVAGIVLGAGYVPFNQLLLAAGKPGWNTLMVGLVFVFNLVWNLVLVPIQGSLGAAIAAALTFPFAALLLRFAVRRLLHARI